MREILRERVTKLKFRMLHGFLFVFQKLLLDITVYVKYFKINKSFIIKLLCLMRQAVKRAPQ